MQPRNLRSKRMVDRQAAKSSASKVGILKKKPHFIEIKETKEALKLALKCFAKKLNKWSAKRKPWIDYVPLFQSG